MNGFASVTSVLSAHECIIEQCFFFCFSGTFALLQAYAFLVYLRTKISWTDFKNIFVFAVVTVAGLVFVAVIFLTYAGMYHST